MVRHAFWSFLEKSADGELYPLNGLPVEYPCGPSVLSTPLASLEGFSVQTRSSAGRALVITIALILFGWLVLLLANAFFIGDMVDAAHAGNHQWTTLNEAIATRTGSVRS